MFNRIALITSTRATRITDTLQTVVELLRRRGIAIVLDDFSASLLPDSGLESRGAPDLPEGCDLAIAIGGDGTMLRAARLMADHDVPLVGINRGRLGFLADIPANAVDEQLGKILDGDYVTDERFLLDCEAHLAGGKIVRGVAFNDVIIQKWHIARLIELQTFVNGKLLHSQRADGLIIASPTGSTAYAMSGGGPILQPSLDALVLVPICPHTLSNRPIVIEGNSTIELVVGTPEINHANLTCDGDIACELSTGNRVVIRKKDNTVRLIHPPGHDHFGILRAKLQWG